MFCCFSVFSGPDCPIHLCDLDLECGVWVSEVCPVVFDSLVPPVKAIPTAVAVPVCSFKPLLSFNGAHNLTVVTATKHFQACRVHKGKYSLLQKNSALMVIYTNRCTLTMRSEWTKSQKKLCEWVGEMLFYSSPFPYLYLRLLFFYDIADMVCILNNTHSYYKQWIIK